MRVCLLVFFFQVLIVLPSLQRVACVSLVVTFYGLTGEWGGGAAFWDVTCILYSNVSDGNGGRQ
jgi:hypothetical protein